MDELAAKEYLLKHDERFRELAKEHQDYERQLQEFHTKPYLSPEEQIQETVLKKKKLVLKDRMQILIQQLQG